MAVNFAELVFAVGVLAVGTTLSFNVLGVRRKLAIWSDWQVPTSRRRAGKDPHKREEAYFRQYLVTGLIVLAIGVGGLVQAL